jgi:hypothetical protein
MGKILTEEQEETSNGDMASDTFSLSGALEICFHARPL